MDTLAAMRVFARSVESGSFSAASRQLGLAPSSVSRQIGELEDDLGARLFNRTTRKLSLTEAGQQFYASARRILVEVDEARLAVTAESSAAPSGILRAAVPASLCRLHIAPALGEFRARYPAVELVLAVGDRQVDMVEEGFDLAVRVGRPRNSSLIARKLGAARRIVCASPGYLARAGTPLTPHQLADHDCLTFRDHPGANPWAFRSAQGRVEVRASGPVLANDGEVLVAAAVAGMGVALLPEWLPGGEIARGRLVEILADVRAIPDTTPLYALYPHQRHLPPKVRVFIDFLVERFAAPYAWDGAA